MSQGARTRLIYHLSGVAGYNDRGHEWLHHMPQEVSANQDEAQAVIMRLVAEIGEDAFSADLLRKLKSGAAAKDFSGDIHLQAKAELLGPSRS